jgi:hypothetical protein
MTYFGFKYFVLFRCQDGVKGKAKKAVFRRQYEKARTASFSRRRWVQLSLRKAAEQNHVSFQTLQRYVKKKKSKAHPHDQVSMKSNYKHRLVFSENKEN